MNNLEQNKHDDKSSFANDHPHKTKQTDDKKKSICTEHCDAQQQNFVEIYGKKITCNKKQILVEQIPNIFFEHDESSKYIPVGLKVEKKNDGVWGKILVVGCCNKKSLYKTQRIVFFNSYSGMKMTVGKQTFHFLKTEDVKGFILW